VGESFQQTITPNRMGYNHQQSTFNSKSMKNYRVRVETNDGCVTFWYEKSSAKRACDLINNRVYNQLCGLNIKEVSVTPSV
jgi:hypothetical protein